MKKNSVWILMIFLINHCIAQKNIYQCDGTIIVINGQYCEVFTKGKMFAKFKVKPDKIDSHNDNIAFNQIRRLDQSRFIANEQITAGLGLTYLSNIVILNLKGKVIERLINNNKYHYANNCIPNNNNTKVLYFTGVSYPSSKIDTLTKAEFAATLHTPDRTLHVMDFKSRKEELAVSNFSKSAELTLTDGCWSPDSKMIVYSIDPNFLPGSFLGKDFEDTTTAAGSYIYNIEKKMDIKFIAGGKDAAWCPDSNIVAYLKQSDIWLYNVNTDTHSLFLKSEKKIRISNFHWTPDGDYLYVQQRGYNDYKPKEKIYRVEDGVEIKFKKPKLTNGYYSWR